MPGRALTPMGVVIKWIFIPAVLIAGGFFLIGAKIGGYLPGFGSGKAVEVTPVSNDGSKSYGEPDVDVQRAQTLVPPEVQVSSEKKARRRKPRVHPVPSAETDTSATPSQDSFSPRSGHTYGPG